MGLLVNSRALTIDSFAREKWKVENLTLVNSNWCPASRQIEPSLEIFGEVMLEGIIRCLPLAGDGGMGSGSF